jgi:hypothetical protein
LITGRSTLDDPAAAGKSREISATTIGRSTNNAFSGAQNDTHTAKGSSTRSTDAC